MNYRIFLTAIFSAVIAISGCSSEGSKSNRTKKASLSMDAAPAGTDFNYLTSPEKLIECHDKGLVYDWQKDDCHSARVASDPCSLDDAEKLLTQLEDIQDIKNMFSSLSSDDWELDQCGLIEDKPIIFFKKLKKEDEGRKVSLVIHTIGYKAEGDATAFEFILEKPAKFDECHEEGKLYDWAHEKCDALPVATSYECSIEPIIKRFGAPSRELFEGVLKDGWVLDQCGENERKAVIFFTKMKREGLAAKVSVKKITESK